MDNNLEKNNEIKIEPDKKPNENIGFYFSSSVKITDPNTGQVLVQLRAD